jgi:hypothetical protein
MAEKKYQLANQEQRKERRKPDQVFVIIKPLDEAAEKISLAIDRSESGAGIVTHIPLPVGTRVEIRAGDDFFAIGEVTDWNWDAKTDMVRLGMRLVERRGNWPQPQE